MTVTLAVAEGMCPYGHGRLEIVELHGRQQGSCRECECSWFHEDGVTWGVACVPGSHTCGER